MVQIPKNVLTAVVSLLEPYGVDLERLLKNAKK